MKRILLYISVLGGLLPLAGCTSFSDVKDVEQIRPVSVVVNVNSRVESVTSLEGMTIVFEKVDENFRLEAEVPQSGTVNVDDLIPGFYTINVGGETLGNDGLVYRMNDSKLGYPIMTQGEVLSFSLAGVQESPLLFKELFYTNLDNNSGGQYIFAQYWELYNNSDFEIFLDGVHFADLIWTAANAAGANYRYMLADTGQEPGIDFDNYIYADRIWKFPGSGTDYPLRPGESVILVQRAQIHDAITPVRDYRAADFEFFMPSGNYEDFAAPNMEHVYYRNSEAIGTLRQYMPTINGPAMAIFRVPQGESYSPANNMPLQIYRVSGSNNIYSAKVPIDWVLDAVECGLNSAAAQYKRVSGVLDSGMFYLGDTRSGRSISRKLSEQTGPGGEIRLVDTNNSTEDFEIMDQFVFRRHGVAAPAWNHALNQ